MAEKKNTIGRFEIIEKIGEGPIGAVYKALDPVIRRTVAIKVIKLYALEETTTFAEIFEKIYRVVRTSTSLNHPNICIIYDLSEEKKIPYITMEFIEGQDVDSLLQKKHQFKRAQLLSILGQVCDALDFAHKRNVIHQDLKTTNIIVTPDLQVKITDFGIAGLDEIAAAQTKKLLSIPYYISPEQALGEKVTPESDLFSLGVIMYHLLSGELPFRGTTAANVIMTIARDNPAVPTNLQKSGIEASDWNAFFNKALAKNPTHRFTGAREMYDALVSIIPLSDHSYFPYSFSGGAADNTGKFEKTFVSDPVSAPTVMIDPRQIFAQQAAEQPPLNDVSETLIGQVIDHALDFDQTAPSSAEITHADIGSQTISNLQPEPPAVEPAPSVPVEDQEEIATILATDDEPAEKTVFVTNPVVEPAPEPPAPAPPTQLIKIPQEFISEAAEAKPNGNEPAMTVITPPEPAPSSAATQLISVPVQTRHEQPPPVFEELSASSKPTMMMQGTAAMLDPRPPEPVPPAPRVTPIVPPAPSPAQKRMEPAPRKAAGPPNLKRYLIAAVILAFFIALFGGYLLLRKPSTVEEAQNPSTSSQSPSTSTTKPSGATSAQNPPANATPATTVTVGKISIASTPSGAKVIVNGQDRGVTPMELSDVAEGSYDVQVQLNGYKDLQQMVEITEQNPNSAIQAVLEKTVATVGTLVIESTPPEAFIVIGNRVVGVTPKTLPNTKTGKYNITLKKDGYEDYTGTVRITADKTAALRAHLTEIPKPVAPVQETKKEEPQLKPGTLVELGPGVTPPKSVKKTFAKYPEAAKARKIQGTIVMRALVSETGNIIDIKVVSSPNKLLEDAAVKTVRGWVYEPARKEGVPVKVWIPVSMAFQVSNQ